MSIGFQANWFVSNLVLILLVLITNGCTSESTSVKKREDKREHHIPPHKPASLLDSIPALKNRIREIEENASNISDIQVSEFKEIIDWIPELAADSDLNHKDWNEVNELSHKIKKIFSEIENQLNQNKEVQAQINDFNLVVSQLNLFATKSEKGS